MEETFLHIDSAANKKISVAAPQAQFDSSFAQSKSLSGREGRGQFNPSLSNQADPAPPPRAPHDGPRFYACDVWRRVARGQLTALFQFRRREAEPRPCLPRLLLLASAAEGDIVSRKGGQIESAVEQANRRRLRDLRSQAGEDEKENKEM